MVLYKKNASYHFHFNNWIRTIFFYQNYKMSKHINDTTATPQSSKKKRGLWKKQYTKFITRGLIISLPIIIVIFVLSIVFELIFGVLSPISNIIDPLAGEPHWLVHVLSALLLIFFFYTVGAVVDSKSGKRQISRLENEYLMQLPLYSTVRDLVHQFAGMKKMPFSKVVLVDPFDSGVLMTGFITEEVQGDIYTVFVPTAPNPTNGNIYHVPVSRLHFIDIASDAAMRTVVGMGTGSSILFEKSHLEVQKITPNAVPDSVSTEVHALSETQTLVVKDADKKR